MSDMTKVTVPLGSVPGASPAAVPATAASYALRRSSDVVRERDVPDGEECDVVVGTPRDHAVEQPVAEGLDGQRRHSPEDPGELRDPVVEDPSSVLDEAVGVEQQRVPGPQQCLVVG